MDSPIQAGDKAHAVLLPAAILMAALALRILDIHWHPFGPDEGWTWELASGLWPDLFAKTARDTHPPLHYVLVKLLFLAFGNDIYWGKLLSVLFSTGTLWVTYLLASRWFGRHAAIAALLFGSFAPYQVYWSHVARNHLLLPFFTTAIILLSDVYTQNPARKTWLLLAGAWALAIQTNYMAFAFGLVWGIAFVLPGTSSIRTRSLLAMTALPGLLLFLPWIPILRAHTQDSPMTLPFFQEFVSPLSLYHHAIFGRMTHLQQTHLDPYFWATMLTFALIVVAGARAAGRRWRIWFLLLGLPGIPIAIAWIADYTLAERHLLFALPLFFAYWGAAVIASADWIRNRYRSPHPSR